LSGYFQYVPSRTASQGWNPIGELLVNHVTLV
jgi:hypothetical protein